MFQCFPGDLNAAQHASQLFYTLILTQCLDSRARRLAVTHLDNSKMLVRKASDLWQVSDTQHLSIGGEFL